MPLLVVHAIIIRIRPIEAATAGAAILAPSSHFCGSLRLIQSFLPLYNYCNLYLIRIITATPYIFYLSLVLAVGGGLSETTVSIVIVIAIHFCHHHHHHHHRQQHCRYRHQPTISYRYYRHQYILPMTTIIMRVSFLVTMILTRTTRRLW